MSRAHSWRAPYQRDELPIAIGYLLYAVRASLGVAPTSTMRALGGFSEDDYAGGSDDVEFC
jgi:hypothetical protein